MSSHMVLGSGTMIPESREGGITRTMRAAAAPLVARKVLRVARVRADRIVGERIIREPVDVTIGDREDAMLASRRATFTLFEVHGGDYYLNVVDGMTGRIGVGDSVTEIAYPLHRPRLASPR